MRWAWLAVLVACNGGPCNNNNDETTPPDDSSMSGDTGAGGEGDNLRGHTGLSDTGPGDTGILDN